MRRLRRVLLAIAAGLTVTAAASFAAGGLRLTLGPLSLSAADPGRVALEAALVALLAILAAPPRDRRFSMCAITLVLLCAVADSKPREVGDGAEYIAMASNLSRLRPPAPSHADLEQLRAEHGRVGGYSTLTFARPLLGADGRQDFPHFWLYPLTVAPLLTLARVLGAHPNHAFTALNLALFAALAWLLIRRDRTIAAALLAAGPCLWWLDKAHTEIFLFVSIATAMLLTETHPPFALLAAAVATAQNPGAGLVLAGIALHAITTRPRAITAAAVTAASAMAVLPSLYYWWRLGSWSPLAHSVSPHLPGLRDWLTPVIDPNLGLLPYAPVLAGLAVSGLWVRDRRFAALTIGVMAALLVVFAQSGNVNHGASPGMSRYGVWLLAVMTPLLADGAERLRSGRPALLFSLSLVSLAMSWYAFRPALPDRGGAAPSLGASILWSRLPGLDNPLPEVFAERVSQINGLPPVPVATRLCEKVLIRGDGVAAWWPFPCEPQAAPPRCVASGALCYCNRGDFVAAPAQGWFAFDPTPGRSWSVASRDRLGGLLLRLGEGARIVHLASGVRHSDGGDELLPLYIVEGPAGAAIWVRARVFPGAVLRLKAARMSDVEVLSATSHEVVQRFRLPAGSHRVALPSADPLLVVITDADGGG